MLYTLFYYTLSTIIKITGTAYYVNWFGELYFPIQTIRLRSYLIWQGLKVFTLFELQANKYIIKGKTLLDTFFPNKARLEDVHFIHNGIVVNSYNSSCFIENNKEVFPECDFILFYLHTNGKYNYNVVRFPDVTTFINSYNNNCIEEYTPSSIKFLGMKININNSTVDINFGKNNFYMNGNVLFDRSFVKFYLNTFHEITLKDHEDYKITFIEPDMEIMTIKEEHYIQLSDDAYHIRFIQN